MLSSSHPSQSSPTFTEQQLKQLRAQCLVFLAVRNNMQPTKKHLEIALGESCAQGSSSSSDGRDKRDETETGSSSSPAVFSIPTAVLPPPDPLALSRLQLSSSPRPRSGPTRRIVRGGPRKIQ
ncbi:hypothetical protein BDA96_05G166400 [Sorghum bicolor]|uniref:QLQ domain-containing protein n=2 Tax=Sorghum bicolor TaxID=4558 RepID=A0A921UHL5_SORBI|nr:hypothetical protein BDA96_05G166400 [Sorghum bicolor]KXG28681.1 hypothetical protein SORBI_3005G152500 [Sorghum bicolor]